MSESFVESKRARYEYLREKKGSKEGDTHGAHYLGIGMVKEILEGSKGRPVREGTKDLYRALNDSSNVREKTAHGNLVLDKRRDERITEALRSGGRLHEGTTIHRAAMIYAHAGKAAEKHDNATMQRIVDSIGELTISTGKPGRPMKIKNYHL